MKDKIPLIIILVIVVAIIVLAIVFGSKKEGEEGTPETGGLPEGVEIAEEIYGFSGEIKEIQDKTLLIEAKILMANPEEEAVETTVKAKVTDLTRIAKLKFPEIPEGSTEPVYPEETEMSFEELKVGDHVDISTIENISENIKNGTEFVVNDVFIVE